MSTTFGMTDLDTTRQRLIAMAALFDALNFDAEMSDIGFDRIGANDVNVRRRNMVRLRFTLFCDDAKLTGQWEQIAQFKDKALRNDHIRRYINIEHFVYAVAELVQAYASKIQDFDIVFAACERMLEACNANRKAPPP